MNNSAPEVKDVKTVAYEMYAEAIKNARYAYGADLKSINIYLKNRGWPELTEIK